ncbi:MAG: protease inhibitor I42 family protein [Candidatus Margulisiibacteriota bacterium]
MRKFRPILALTLTVLAFTTGSAFAAENRPDLIQTKPYSSFSIRLRSNPTTGYSWKISKISDKRIVKASASRYEPDRPVLSGSGGQEIWSFKALRPGKARIEMSYQRPWEKGVPPARTKTFSIRVR